MPPTIVSPKQTTEPTGLFRGRTTDSQSQISAHAGSTKTPVLYVFHGPATPHLARPVASGQRAPVCSPAPAPGGGGGPGVAAVGGAHLVELTAPRPHEQLAAVPGGEHAPNGGVQRDAGAPRPGETLLAGDTAAAADPSGEGLVSTTLRAMEGVRGEGREPSREPRLTGEV